MTDTHRRWDRLPTATHKSYAAFLAYVALGARRSVREAARQYHIKTTSLGQKYVRSMLARPTRRLSPRGTNLSRLRGIAFILQTYQMLN